MRQILAILLVFHTAGALADGELCKPDTKFVDYATNPNPQGRMDFTVYACGDGWHFNVQACSAIVKIEQRGQDQLPCVSIKGGSPQCCKDGKLQGSAEGTTNCDAEKGGNTVTKSTSFKCGKGKKNNGTDEKDQLYVVGPDGNTEVAISGDIPKAGQGQHQSAHMDIKQLNMNTSGGNPDDNEGRLGLANEAAKGARSGTECDDHKDELRPSKADECSITTLLKKDIGCADDNGKPSCFKDFKKNGAPVISDTTGTVSTSRDPSGGTR